MMSLVESALHALPIALPALLAGYLIFGLTGFGTALIAAPILAHAMPVATIVPLLALLDCVAAFSTGLRRSKDLSKTELKLLLPLMLLGTIVGATLLIYLPPRAMMTALGLFVICYAVYGLCTPPPTTHISRGWAAIFGPIGGIFSATFGSGGPIYAMYLSRRLHERNAFRATQATLLGFATITRGVIFAIAGFYTDGRLLILAVLLLPAMIAGLWVASLIAGRLSRERFLHVLHFVLIASGLSLLARALVAS
jgi:uncharacterized protein